MSKLEKKFASLLTKRGYPFLTNGYPDFLVIKDSTIVGVEVKSKCDHLRDNQIEMLNTLENAGVRCFVYKELHSGKCELISFTDAVSKDQLFKIPGSDWKTTWQTGRESLLNGIDTLKKLGIDDQAILIYVRTMLSGWTRELVFTTPTK